MKIRTLHDVLDSRLPKEIGRRVDKCRNMNIW